MNWTDYEERYGEGREDFTDEEETSWEQAQADAIGVSLYGPL